MLLDTHVSVVGGLTMDKRTEWPWSLDEEAEWKAELERREQDSVEELIGETIENESGDVFGISEEEGAEGIPERYSVTA